MAIKFSTKKPEAVKVEVKQAPEAEISKTLKESGKVIGEDHQVEKVEHAPGVGETVEVEQPWCEVAFESRYTHNLGNYQSVQVGVRIMIPCKPPEINDIYNFCKEFVDERLGKEVQDLQA